MTPATRVTTCLEVHNEDGAQVVEHMNRAADELIIQGVRVLDSSIKCEPICADDEEDEPND